MKIKTQLRSFIDLGTKVNKEEEKKGLVCANTQTREWKVASHFRRQFGLIQPSKTSFFGVVGIFALSLLFQGGSCLTWRFIMARMIFFFFFVFLFSWSLVSHTWNFFSLNEKRLGFFFFQFSFVISLVALVWKQKFKKL